MKASTKRKIGVAAAIVFLFLILISFMAVLIPQLLESIMTLSTQLSDYLGKANTLLNEITEGLGFKTGWLEILFSSSEALLESMLGMAKDYVPKILSYSWLFVVRLSTFLSRSSSPSIFCWKKNASPANLKSWLMRYCPKPR